MAPIAAHHGIVFIGFMAAGKTRAAEAVAERLGLGVIDTDDLLEGELGEPISSFFEREGEIEFRRREERLMVSVLDALAPGWRAVVSGRARGRRDRERGHTPRARRPPAGLVRRRRGRPPGSGLRGPTGPSLSTARSSPSASRAGGRSTSRSHERSCPSAARDAAGPAAPWLAAMQGTPGVRMVWAESESGSYPAAVGEGAIGLLDDAREALPEALPARTFCVADDEALRHHRPLLPRTRGGHRRPGRRDLEDDRRGRADSERALLRGRKPRRLRAGLRGRRGRGPGRLLRRHLPARRPARPGADHPGRPGRLGLRRQDRSRPARGQELRRRVPHADRGPGRSQRRSATLPARGARGRIRRGRQDRADRRRPALVPGQGDRGPRSRGDDAT